MVQDPGLVPSRSQNLEMGWHCVKTTTRQTKRNTT
jgi:hypothetical protein